MTDSRREHSRGVPCAICDTPPEQWVGETKEYQEQRADGQIVTVTRMPTIISHDFLVQDHRYQPSSGLWNEWKKRKETEDER